MPELVPDLLPRGTLSGRPQPRLAAGPLRLRPFTEADVPVLVDAYADPDVQRWHCRSLDDAEARALVRRWREGWAAESAASWAVTDDAGRVLGRTGFRSIDLAGGVAEVAYWVLPAARGRGVARGAVAELVRWAVQDTGLHRLELRHSVANAASCAVARTCGFALEGTLRSAVRHLDGWHDMHLHALLPEDDPASRQDR